MKCNEYNRGAAKSEPFMSFYLSFYVLKNVLYNVSYCNEFGTCTVPYSDLSIPCMYLTKLESIKKAVWTFECACSGTK